MLRRRGVASLHPPIIIIISPPTEAPPHRIGTTASGARITTKVTGDRDPGYGSTAKMLGEAAMALLALDPADVPGGFWTPSAAFGDTLMERLVEHAGLTFEVID